MVRSVKQLEKNVELSFSYVKKDLLMVNDSVGNLNDKIQHLSLNQAMLLEKMTNIEKLLSNKKAPVAKKKASKQKKLSFYDVKSKKKFTSSDYIIRNVKGRRMAVAVSPSKTQAYRILGSVKGSKNKPKKKFSVKKVVKKQTKKSPKKVITETVLYE